MNRELLFVPGNNYQQKDYPMLLGILGDLGHTVFTPRMNWNGVPNPRAWADSVLDQTDNHPFTAILGHSFGGATSLFVASDLVERGEASYTQLLLCSHSAVFSDDLAEPQVSTWLTERYGSESLAVLAGMHIQPLTETIKRAPQRPEVTIFYGEHEKHRIKQRAEKTAKLFGVQPTVVFNAAHELENTDYVQAIAAQF